VLQKAESSIEVALLLEAINDIIEIFPDGRREVRFRPLAPDILPQAMERLCPNVSRDTIRLIMNRWRKQGKLEMLASVLNSKRANRSTSKS
jgi:hypothetical protein